MNPNMVPAMNPGINHRKNNLSMNPMAVTPIQNPHMITFNPLITDDFKIAKILEINNRL
jgi:hypothetical protein